MATVKIHDIEAEVAPSGLCAMIMPYPDCEARIENLTLQQELNGLSPHQLAIFAAVQAVEWRVVDIDKDDDATDLLCAQQAGKWSIIFMRIQERRGVNAAEVRAAITATAKKRHQDAAPTPAPVAPPPKPEVPKAPPSSDTPTWSAVCIIMMLSQAFWWFMFATPFLKLLERLVAGIDRISPP